MALSANANYEVRPVEGLLKLAMKVLTSSVIYNGSFCSHDTTVGAIKPYDGTSADRVVGWHFGDTVTGNTAASVPPEASICPGGFTIVGLTVAGLTTVLDSNLGLPVWATDDGTYTATDPSSTGHEVGNIVRYHSSGKADVTMRNRLDTIEA